MRRLCALIILAVSIAQPAQGLAADCSLVWSQIDDEISAVISGSTTGENNLSAIWTEAVGSYVFKRTDTVSVLSPIQTKGSRRSFALRSRKSLRG